MATHTSLRRVNVIVYILVVLFGIASWVDISGIWVELPIMVQELPEGWSLPSYIVVIIQMANIAPLLFTAASTRCPRRFPEKGIIYAIIGVGALSCLLLVFFWNRTTPINGVDHSTALFVLNFFLAFVDTTSSVAFLPFMATFRPAYMTAYFIGQSLCGLLPALLGLAQGAGRIVCQNTSDYTNLTVNGSWFVDTTYSVKTVYTDTKFSIEVFFMCITGLLVISGIAFSFLIFHPRCKKEYAVTEPDDGKLVEKCQQKTKFTNKYAEKMLNLDKMDLEEEGSDFQTKLTEVLPDENSSRNQSETAKRMTKTEYIVSLFLTGWVCALTNAVLISVQTYSCLPYGAAPYHLTVTLTQVANPLASFLAFFVYVTSVRTISAVTAMATLLGVYIMTAAIMSPTPVLVGTQAGAVLIVAVWVGCMFLMTYVRVCLAAMFRSDGKKGLLHCGAVTQVGSFIGGVTMFVSVNVLHLFTMAHHCSQH